MANLEKGKFIVLEGQGFSGKSEQQPLLAEKLKGQGFEVVETQEPGGVQSALDIRAELLKRREAGTITSEEEVELFYKSRERFLDELVRPSVADGKWVLSTRFSASTFVYQGREGGVSLDLIRDLDQRIVNGSQPDLYILIDVEPNEIMKRLTSQGARQRHSYNEIDREKIITRQLAYLELANENQYKNWVIVDGNSSIEEVHQRIWQEVRNKFEVN